VKDYAGDLCEVIVTAPDAEWLGALARQLVEMRLCASAHVVAPIRAIYEWQGSVQDVVEARAFLRARRTALETIVKFVTARHPYEVPNVTAIPIIGGNSDYLAWVRKATTEPT
jgi:periplasmic divalent cation tolerance protein